MFTVDDYEELTGIAAGDSTERQLDVALMLARRYCGWHVTPAQVDDLILDGRGGTTLRLPTQYLIELIDLAEDGVALDIDELDVSPLGQVEKPWGNYWTMRLGGIAVTMSHGFSAAPVFESVVLNYVARTSSSIGGIRPTTVGPFSYGSAAAVTAAAFSSEEKMMLDLYRLEPHP
jgi:hypothetical protein